MTHILSMFGRRSPPVVVHETPPPAFPEVERLNQLETRVKRLELDNAERQVAVLSSLEKVLHQLRARDRKREATQDAPGQTIEDEVVLDHPPRRARPAVPPSTLNIRGW